MSALEPMQAAATIPTRSRAAVALLALIVAGLPGPAAQAQDESALRTTEYPYNTDADGNDLPIELGHFDVPVDWADDRSATMILGFVRYLAGDDASGYPVVFLVAGRPREAAREQLYASLRQSGDVYEFNYRGFGLSSASWSSCPARLDLPVDKGLSRRSLERATRQLADRCEDALDAAGLGENLLSPDNLAADVGRFLSLVDASRIVLVVEGVLLEAGLAILEQHGDAVAGLVVGNPTLSVPDGERAVPLPIAGELADREQGFPLNSDIESSIRVGMSELDFAFLSARARQSQTFTADIRQALKLAAAADESKLAALVYDTRIALNDRVVSLALATHLPRAEFRRWRRASDVEYAWWWPMSSLNRASTKRVARVLADRGLDVLVVDRGTALDAARPMLDKRFAADGTLEFAAAADNAVDVLVDRQAALLQFVEGLPRD